jgi:hypothetical protein
MSGLSQKRRKAEAEQAEDYAWAIRNAGMVKPDWKALNARIIDEFGLAGLMRIKRAAWKAVEGG